MKTTQVIYLCVILFVFVGLLAICGTYVFSEDICDVAFMEDELEWGRYPVECGAIEKIVRFKNNSPKSVHIEELKMSCNCSHADYSKEAIAPGEYGWIKIKIDSEGKYGKNKIQGMVVFAPYQKQLIKFMINIELCELLTVFPRDLNQVEIDLSGVNPQTIKVRNNTTSSVKVVKIESLNKYILPEAIDFLIKSGEEVVLPLKINNTIPFGKFEDEIYLFTDCIKIQKKIVKINGYTQIGNLHVSNRKVDFGFISKSQHNEAAICMSSNNNEEFKITGYQCKSKSITIKYGDEFGLYQNILLSSMCENENPGELHGFIVFDIEYKNGNIGKVEIEYRSFYQ